LTVGISVGFGGGSFGLGPIPAETGSVACSPQPAIPSIIGSRSSIIRAITLISASSAGSSRIQRKELVLVALAGGPDRMGIDGGFSGASKHTNIRLQQKGLA